MPRPCFVLFRKHADGDRARKKCLKFNKLTSVFHASALFVTITAEIHAHSFVNLYRQYAYRHMNLKFMWRVSARERTIRPFVIVKNKLMSVFNECPVIDNEFRHHIVKVVCRSTATLTMWWQNLWSIIGQTHKKLTSICQIDPEFRHSIVKVAGRLLWQWYDEIHCQQQDRRIKTDINVFFYDNKLSNWPLSHRINDKYMCLFAYWQQKLANERAWISAVIANYEFANLVKHGLSFLINYRMYVAETFPNCITYCEPVSCIRISW